MESGSDGATYVKLGPAAAKKTAGLFDNLITFDELLALFKGKVPKKTVYAWIHRSGMPSRRIGRHLFFDKVAVEKWVEGTFS